MTAKFYRYNESDLEGLDSLGGNYFCFRQNFLRLMGAKEAILLQKLINYSNAISTKTRNYEGWFRFTVKTCERHLCMDKKAQTLVLKHLIEMGYILTKKVGIPPIRWVWIDMEKVKADLRKVRQEVEDTDEFGPMGKESSPTTGKESSPTTGKESSPTHSRRESNKKNTNSRVSRRCRPDAETACSSDQSNHESNGHGTPKKGRPVPSLTGNKKSVGLSEELTDLLYNTVKGHRRRRKPPDLSLWKRSMTRLLNEEGEDRVEPILRWYCANFTKYMDDQWFPRAECPNSLYVKWDKIIAFKERSSKPRRNNEDTPPKSKIIKNGNRYTLTYDD